MAKEASLTELVKSLDNLDLSKLTVSDLKAISNPVLADALRKMIDLELLRPGDPAHGHTSHYNHLSHSNHASHYSSMALEEIPERIAGKTPVKTTRRKS